MGLAPRIPHIPWFSTQQVRLFAPSIPHFWIRYPTVVFAPQALRHTMAFTSSGLAYICFSDSVSWFLSLDWLLQKNSPCSRDSQVATDAAQSAQLYWVTGLWLTNVLWQMWIGSLRGWGSYNKWFLAGTSSVVNSKYCSCRRSKLCSHHPGHNLQPSQLQQILDPLLTSMGARTHVDIPHTQTESDTAFKYQK